MAAEKVLTQNIQTQAEAMSCDDMFSLLRRGPKRRGQQVDARMEHFKVNKWALLKRNKHAQKY